MKTLAIAQIILGVLSLDSLLGFNIWVEPGFYHIQLPPMEGSDLTTKIFFNPGRNIPMRSWQTVSFVLALSVLGCGITQFLKVRILKGAKPI